MIKIYVSPSCSSCRKVKKWFDERKIPYEEKNIFSSNLKEDELRDILTKSENGTDDIISTKSKIVKEQKVDFNSMSISQMIDFIRKNPSILKRPIMVDTEKDRMQVGYNADDIRIFIPRAQRELDMMCYAQKCIDDEAKEKQAIAKKN